MLTYRFTGSHAGYGNRPGTVTAPVITEPMVRVTVTDGSVTSAVIDERWDQTGQFMIGSEQSLSYRPKKCGKTSWQYREEKSGRVYIRMPTDEEIIQHYSASIYGIDVKDVKKVPLGPITCDACDVCWETCRFDLTVNSGGMQPVPDKGWMRTA